MSKPKGQIKVELFCAKTGTKQHETRCTNFISRGLEYAYNYAMRNLFTRGKATGRNEITINDPFYRMHLTDNDKDEEAVEEWNTEGQIIGYALTTEAYSGDSTTRGSYNTSESFTDAEQVHIVVDFPTHAANGTFESIYFTPENSMYETNNHYFSNKIREEVNEIVSLQRYKDVLYILGRSIDSSRYLYLFDLNYDIIDTIDFSLNILDFHIKGDVFYFCDTSRNIKKCPLSNFEDITTLLNINRDGREPGGICYDDNNDKWLVTVSRSSRTDEPDDTETLIYNNGFELLDTIPQTWVQSRGYIKIYEHKGMHVLSFGNVFDYERGFIGKGGSNKIRGFIDDEYIINSNGYILPKYLISSRVLLDAPVTKTENTTMKITYDFMLPPLY